MTMRWFTRQLSAFMTLAVLASPSFSWGFQLNDFWRTTATDGSGNTLGSPITLTWGIIPDGTPSAASGGSSDLISFMDTIIGAGPGGSDLTQRPWFTPFEQSFNRWGELSGVTYVYEPNDDGALHSSATGILGVRPDIRIRGSFIDGSGNVLAFNSFPDNGDMTIDTGDAAFYSNASGNYLPLRNVIMHEHGHGLGMSHVESDNRRFLMEPFIDTNFDGPQLDDLLAAHRGYGDAFEKANGGAGNDIAANAIDLGLIANGANAEVGTNGSTPRILPFQNDFVSIDDNSDIDFYAFTVGSTASVDITLTPIGPTYNQGPQGGTQSAFDASAQSNLAVALFAGNGTSILAFDDSGGLGQADMISDFSLDPGEYFVRATGAANMIQLYNLRIDVTAGTLRIDFDSNGFVDCADIDALTAQIVAGTNATLFDLTGDGNVNENDLAQWLSEAGAANGLAGPYVAGDANLDGAVDTADFDIWSANRFSSSSAWCSGDFTLDSAVDVSDFHVWNENRGTIVAVAAAVPEPASLGLLALAGLCMAVGRRRD